MVEGAPLLREYTEDRIEGSNPFLSAILKSLIHSARTSDFPLFPSQHPVTHFSGASYLQALTPSFVTRRGPVFWFRKTVPIGLTPCLGNADIRRSLRTRNLRTAARRGWILVRAVEEAFATLRSAGLEPDARSAFGAILDHVMNDFDSPQTRWAERAKYRFLIERLAGDEPLVPKPQPVNLTTVDHAPRRPSHPVGHVLQSVETSEATGMSFGRTTIHHKEHAPTVDNVSAPAIPVSAADVASLIERGVEAAVRRAIARPGSEDLLSSRVPAFLDKKREELGDNAKHLADYPGRIGVFLAIVGDKPIGSYSTDDMHRFREIVD